MLPRTHGVRSAGTTVVIVGYYRKIFLFLSDRKIWSPVRSWVEREASWSPSLTAKPIDSLRSSIQIRFAMTTCRSRDSILLKFHWCSHIKIHPQPWISSEHWTTILFVVRRTMGCIEGKKYKISKTTIRPRVNHHSFKISIALHSFKNIQDSKTIQIIPN